MAYFCKNSGAECDGCGECTPKEEIYCEECGQLLEDEYYSDIDYDFLCRDCLLILHMVK